jgi:PAS domain S-box-containing protein
VGISKNRLETADLNIISDVFRIDENYTEEEILESWRKFVNGVSRGLKARKYIIESWQRSKALGIDPFMKRISNGISNLSISKDSDQQRLINASETFLDSLSIALKDSCFAASLFDKNGFKLTHRVSGMLEKKFKEIGNVIGVNFSEKCIGTNAVGLSQIFKKPVQMVGSENYIKIFHKIWQVAIPIKNEEIPEEIMGVLSITSWNKQVDMNTLLGMAFASVKSIEKSLAAQRELEEKQYLFNLLTLSVENMADGFMSIDEKEQIIHINSSTERIIGINREKIVGKPIYDIFDLKPIIFQNKPMEIVSALKNTGSRCVLDISPIFANPENKRGFIVILREIKKVNQTLSRIAELRAHYTFDDMLGVSNQIKHVKEFGKIAAQSFSNVLITGETGTGKEILTQAIHNYKNNKKPFISINCAAMPTELVESELFGYESGSFTGALKSGKVGKFELADGGTIFLDEIGDMPLYVQAKILKVIEDKCIFRIGSTKGIPINVRIIAATNKNLKKEVERKNFREDLFYRLNTLTIELPPLRKRKEDIQIFVQHFLNLLGKRLNKEVKGVTNEVMERFLAYEWPGNIRELRSVIERAIYLAEGDYIEARDLSWWYENSQKMEMPEKNKVTKELRENFNLKKIEKNVIYEVLRQFHGNKRKSAQYLGIGRATLYRKLKEM